MPKKLSEAEVRRYREQGLVFPVPVLSRADALGCKRRYESLHGLGVDSRGGAMTLSLKPHLLFPWLDELVRHPAILDAVEDLIGPDILLYSDIFVVKEPRTSGIFAMHQDRFEWHLEPMEVIHCWLAFTDSTPENGCMRAVPGTHLMGELVHVPDEDKDNVVSYAKKAVGFDESRAVDLVLRAGEMSVHDAGTVHASGPNRTDDKRVGYIMRFMPPHVRPVGHPRNSVTLVRGVDRRGHWELEPRPASELDPACLAVYESLHATHAPTRFKYM